MRNYQLITRVPFEALDDAQARQKARQLMASMKAPKMSVIKLQRLRDNKEPEGVKLTDGGLQ